MNRLPLRSAPGLPAKFFNAPGGVVRDIAGPHSPWCYRPRPYSSLAYELKVVDPETCRVMSVARVAGPDEANAALKLLGRTKFRPVLVSRSMIELLPQL